MTHEAPTEASGERHGPTDQRSVDGPIRLPPRIFLRPLANPLPLGFVGLAGASILLTGVQVGWLPPTAKGQVAVAVLLVAVPLQLISSVMGFLTRDPVASTSMGTLAVAWLTTGAMSISQLTPLGHERTGGLLALFFAGAVLLTAIVASFGNGIAALVLLLAAGRFALNGVQQYFGGAAVGTASGWLGLAVCVVALYAMLALAVEHLGHRPVLPTGRRGMAARALEGSGDAVGAVTAEPGVRSQL